MTTLHTVSRSPNTSDALRRCLMMALADSAVVLLEDGVYGALSSAASAEQLQQKPANMRCFALRADLDARGLDICELLTDVEVIDYESFVDLVCEYDKVQAWF